ncbi:MAG: DUF433 domain-containing protein, partial [Ignavibacteria bacterium]|nr:DUF433 domain-containing protein [Ignavibacteria bacterium]
MTDEINIGDFIIKDPKIRGGRPCIKGTGVSVQRIIYLYKMGLSPDEITEEIGHLTLAQVHAAISYYHANIDQMEKLLANDILE